MLPNKLIAFSSSSDGLATLVIVSVAYVVVMLAIYIWYALALSKVFGKIGGEPWKAWVPVLNEAEVFAKGGVPGWSVVFSFIPIVNFYALYLRIVATSRINAMFGRGTGMTVFAILFPPGWATMLAWASTPKAAPYDARLAGSAAAAASPAVAGQAAQQAPRQYTPPVPAPAAPAPAPTPIAAPAPTTPSVTQAAPAAPVPAPATAPVPAPAPAPTVPAAPPVAAPAPVPTPAAAPVAPPAVAPPAVAPPAVAPAPARAAAPVPPAPPAPAPAAAPAKPIVVPPPSSDDAKPATDKASPIMVHNPWAPDAAEKTAAEATPAKIERPTIAPAPSAPAVEKVAPAVAPATALAAAPAAVAAAAKITPAPPAAAAGPTDDDDDDEYGETIAVDRRPRIRWTLNVDGAGPLSLPTAHVLLGRKPTSTAADTHALSVPDSTRTLSKVHARLDLVDDEWTITDLNSTNGVLVVEADGTETLLDPGAAVPVRGRFILGKVGMSISFEDASS